MNKRILAVLMICIAVSQARAQAPKIDTVAVSILDHMSAVIGDLSSCSVKVTTNYDIPSQHFGLVKHSDEQEVYLHGPDKLLVKSEGDKGSRDFYYNGKTLSYYSQDNNHYAQVQTPSTIVAMIDSVHKEYGIDFPVADFFYPAFVDDIIAESKSLAYLGITKIDGKDCFHIAGAANDKTFQFWISDDAYYLPVKVVIIYTSKEKNPQFEAHLTGWELNPNLPDAIFEFTAPPRAKKIKLAATATHLKKK